MSVYRRAQGALWRRLGADVLVLTAKSDEPQLLSGDVASLWRQLDPIVRDDELDAHHRQVLVMLALAGIVDEAAR
jgi:hypothetical protein